MATEDVNIEDKATSVNQFEEVEGLSAEHREFILNRHGTLAIRPIPSMDPADPYNWPSWKKNVNILLVSFHSMMATFIPSAIIPAFDLLAKDFGTSLTRASYLTSMMIVVFGFAPLIWKPLSNRFGRRPIWLISTSCSAVCNVGCAYCTNYASMAVCRILAAFFISPASAIGAGVIVETFFSHQRGRKLGIWTLFTSIGPSTGPFFTGFIAYHSGWKWIFLFLAIINAVQFVAYLFLGPESRYLANSPGEIGRSTLQREFLSFRRIDPTPFVLRDFYEPLTFGKYLTVLVPAISYALVFSFANVMITVEIPQLFQEKFSLNAQQIGYQFAGIIIGSIIGEQFGGPFSDYVMNRHDKKIGGRSAAEYRLWCSYFGFVMCIVGVIVFGVQIQRLNHYNVTPLIGSGIAAFGNQIITTVLVTYAVDTKSEHSSSVGVFIIFIRQTWAFIGPFFFPAMFESKLNVIGSCLVMSGIMLFVSVPLTMLAQWRGASWR
ncbi:MFS transporter [Dipodascopsis uninucleata]